MKFHLQGVPKTNGPFGEVHPSSKGTFLGHPVGVQIGKNGQPLHSENSVENSIQDI